MSLARPGLRSLVALALAVGVGAGLGAVGFRYLILALTKVFSGHRDYSALGHVPNPLVPSLGIWFIVLVPVVGGLLYGPLVSRFAPEARGHGVPEVMLAVAEHGGRIRPQVAIVKALASALCIGSGGSVGREGPIVQIGAALGSVVGQLARVSTANLRLLVACGAAGGISATFNAPIAGVFFALEVILGDFQAGAFGVVALSSITAAAIAHSFFGDAAFLALPKFALASPVELPLYAALGAAAGAVGVLFIRVLYGIEDIADRVWKGPAWARPAVGGLLLGLLLLAVPQMYGVGYPVLTNAVRTEYAIAFVLLLLTAKIVATSLTIAIGGSGGVFAPSLFIGAMLGSAFGQAVHAVVPGLSSHPGAYALVGMGAVFAGAARAPITALIILFELTGEYAIILPLMVAIVAATAVSQHLSEDTIYTLKLRRRGINIDRPRVPSVMLTIPVSAAMTPLPEAVDAHESLDAAAARLSSQPHQTLPVADGDGEIIGIIGIVDVEEHLSRGSATTVGEAVRTPQPLHADDTLEHATRALALGNDSGLPVRAAHDRQIIGWVTHRDILHVYHHERERLTPSDGDSTPPPRDARRRSPPAPPIDPPAKVAP